MTAPEFGVGVRELLAEARRLGLTWDLRPATVVDERAVTVIIDNDTAETPTTSLIGRAELGERVMTVAVPPSGVYVIGRLSRNGPHIGQSLVRQLAADMSITNDDIPTNDDNIFATFSLLPRNARFAIAGWLWWTSTSTTPDVRIQQIAGSQCNGDTSLFAQPTAATTTVGTIDTGVAANGINHGRGSINGSMAGWLAGWYQTGDTVDDLKFGMAQATSSGTATVLKAGSWVELKRTA